MASSSERQFDEVLQSLFEARTHDLRSEIWTARGPAPKFTKRKIRNAINQLLNLAEEALLRSKQSKEIIGNYDYKKQWHPKRGKGYGRSAKKQNFQQWYERHITTQNCVYVFWSPSSCLYVGRTLNGKGRPTGHFEKHWFGNATRVDVYGFDRKRNVPRFECMFTHWREPSYSKIKPASKKYYSRCPICDVQRHVKTEIKSLFRLR